MQNLIKNLSATYQIKNKHFLSIWGLAQACLMREMDLLARPQAPSKNRLFFWGGGGGTCMGSVRKHTTARGSGAGGTRPRSKPAHAFISYPY